MRPRLLAIDWSGAEDADHVAKAIAVAALEPGENHVKLLGPPDGWRWTRMGVLKLLRERAEGGVPTVAGIDCNFGLPFIDQGSYMSSFAAESAPELWEEVDEISDEAVDLYAGPFVNAHRNLFQVRGFTPKGFQRRFRETEKKAKVLGVTPQPTCVLVGPAQVGMGGLAGMRLLNQLRRNEGVSIWPFDDPEKNTPLTMVEIFPTLHRRAAGVKGNGKISSRVELDRALYNLEAVLTQDITHSLTGDDTDALISVAGMAKAPENPCEWMPRGLDRKMLQTEGWIFGVGADWTGP